MVEFRVLSIKATQNWYFSVEKSFHSKSLIEAKIEKVREMANFTQ